MVVIVELACHSFAQTGLNIIIVAVIIAAVVANAFRQLSFSVPSSRCSRAILVHSKMIGRILGKLMKRQHMLRNLRRRPRTRS